MSGKNMKIAIDCDDAAVDLKSVIYEHLRSAGAASSCLIFRSMADTINKLLI